MIAREEKRKALGKSLNLLRKYLSNPDTNVGRNMEGRGHSDEV